jgi:hypothetical protein
MQVHDRPIHVVILTGALLFAAAGTAHAVSLNPRGVGQVLIYPYYTVNGGNDTLLSLSNATSHAKALRVRIAEGENGRDAYSMNLYLAPFDTWSAVLTMATPTLPGNPPPIAGLRSNDASCAVPAVAAATELVDGGVALSIASFSGANADPGRTAASRVNEGTIEVIEMGTLVDGSPSALATGLAGQARNCAALVDAWAGGYWTQNPMTDLANPSGGLYGTGYVVDVQQGTIFSYNAIALDGFRSDPVDLTGTGNSVVLHTQVGSAHPNLADALTDPIAETAVAEANANGRSIVATYPAARAVDAVSAVLMASTIDNTYLTDTTLGATTNYVFSYPTRRFYTDPAIAGATAIPPFSSLFAGIRANAVSEVIPYRYYDADGNAPTINCGVDLCTNRLQSPGTSVEILELGAGSDAILDSALSMGFDSPGSSPVGYSPAGRMILAPDLSSGVAFLPPRRLLRASNEGKFFSGLPVIGFATLNVVNANAQNGVLANYSAATPFRTLASCVVVSGTDAAYPCP